MKKLILPALLSVLSLIMFSFIAPENLTSVKAFPKIIFGTKSRPNDKGTGCTGNKGICLIIVPKKFTPDMNIPAYQGVAEIKIEGEKIHFTFSQINNDDPTQTLFEVSKDFPLGIEVSSLLNFNNVTLKQGNYPIDYSRNIFGEVYIDFTHD